MVIEDEGLLDELVGALQGVDLWHVGHDGRLVIPQVGQLVLQSAVHLNGYPANFLQTHKQYLLSCLSYKYTDLRRNDIHPEVALTEYFPSMTESFQE